MSTVHTIEHADGDRGAARIPHGIVVVENLHRLQVTGHRECVDAPAKCATRDWYLQRVDFASRRRLAPHRLSVAAVFIFNPLNLCAVAAVAIVLNIVIANVVHPSAHASGTVFVTTLALCFVLSSLRYLLTDILVDYEKNTLEIRNPLRRYVIAFDDLASMEISTYKPVSVMGSRTVGVAAVTSRVTEKKTRTVKVFATLNNIDHDPLMTELHTVARHAFVEFDDRLPKALW